MLFLQSGLLHRRSGHFDLLALSYLKFYLYLWVLLFTTVTSTPTQRALPQQTFVLEPTDITVIRGTNSVVILPCMVQNKVGQLQWTRNGFGLGTDRDLEHFPRYKMIGSDQDGNYSLQISPVELEDDGTYVCQMMAAEGVEPARSKSAKIIVLVAPEAPVIIQGSSLQTTAGMQLSLECESVAGKPAAQLEWLNGKGEVISSGVTLNTEASGIPKLLNSKATLSLSPSRQHDGQNLTCQAKSSALSHAMNTSIFLEVKYPPEVTLTLNNPKITEYDSVTLTCTVKANPEEVIYTWYRNNVVIPGNFSTSMTLTRVTREFHRSAISCEVRNAVGKSKASTTINIAYGPKFTVPPSPVAADRNADVSVICQVDGNPTPDIVWTFEKSNRILSTGSKLTITSMTDEKAGRYRCRATAPGFPEIQDNYLILLKGPPQVRSQLTQYGILGDTLQVECNVRSVPPPNRIRWAQNGMDIDGDGNARYAISQEPMEDGVRNILSIYESTEADFGNYNCTATNNFGTHHMTISLKKQKVVPLMIILTGVIGGIAVVVTLTIVVVLWVRKYKKTKDEEEDHEPEKQSKTSDRSSNDSDLKVEIRTSSSLSNNDSEPWEDGSVGRGGRGSSSGNDTYRYSANYAEPAFPPKVESHNNNGYIPYVDYQRDYNPPPLNETRNSFYGAINRVDPRYQAAYANPYLRSPPSTLPPPQTYTATTCTTPTPTTNSTTAAAVPLTTSTSNTPVTTNATQSPRSETPQGQYITAPQVPLKPGTLATHV